MPGPLPFDRLRDLAFRVFDIVVETEYLTQAFGYSCRNALTGWEAGEFGNSASDAVLIRLHRELWPHRDNAAAFDADALYDLLEFLHDHVSKPLEGWYHDYDRHTHWQTFDRSEAQTWLREKINPILARAEPPVCLTDAGRIQLLTDDGFAQILDAELPPAAPPDVADRVAAAIVDFRGESLAR